MFGYIAANIVIMTSTALDKAIDFLQDQQKKLPKLGAPWQPNPFRSMDRGPLEFNETLVKCLAKVNRTRLPNASRLFFDPSSATVYITGASFDTSYIFSVTPNWQGHLTIRLEKAFDHIPMLCNNNTTTQVFRYPKNTLNVSGYTESKLISSMVARMLIHYWQDELPDPLLEYLHQQPSIEQVIESGDLRCCIREICERYQHKTDTYECCPPQVFVRSVMLFMLRENVWLCRGKKFAYHPQKGDEFKLIWNGEVDKSVLLGGFGRSLQNKLYNDLHFFHKKL